MTGRNYSPALKTRTGLFASFFSPTIPMQRHAAAYAACTTTISAQEQHRINSAHWLCEYSDDIFQTLRECERHIPIVLFRSYQSSLHRHTLLHLLKTAVEKHKLSRTTLHLATYLLDRFMDKYNIRECNLNLITLTCLIVAAKVEEADVNIPKFMELKKLTAEPYTLNDFKRNELKILSTFNFAFIRPTVATFAEYFVSGFLTLDDFHVYRHNWQHIVAQNMQTPCCCCAARQPTTAAARLPWYNNYKEMLTDSSKMLLDFVDVSLSYIRFTNVRPSVLAAACIAAVRQVSCVRPVWTPYLVKLTECTLDVVSPFVEALLALWHIHTGGRLNATPQLLLLHSSAAGSSTATLCDSPDSGIVLCGDTKSDATTDDEDLEDELDDEEEDNLGEDEELEEDEPLDLEEGEYDEEDEDDDDNDCEDFEYENEEGHAHNDTAEDEGIQTMQSLTGLSDAGVPPANAGKRKRASHTCAEQEANNDNDDDDDDDDDSYYCFEYPLLAKRRRPV